MYQGHGSIWKHKLSASMLAGVVYHVYASLEGWVEWSTGPEDGDKGVWEKRPEGGVSHPQPPRKILGDRKEAEEIFFFTQDWPVHSAGLSFPRDRLKHVTVGAVVRVGLITQRMTQCFLQWPGCHTALENGLQANPHLRREGLSDLPQRVWSKW